MKKKDKILFDTILQIQTTDEISVFKKDFSGNFEIHWHEGFEIEIVLSGSGTQILNGKEYPIKKGCAYLLTPNDFHEIKSGNNIELYNISFDAGVLSEEVLNKVLSSDANNIFYFNDNEFTDVIHLCEIIYKETIRKKNYKNEFLKNMLECFLIIFLRKYEFLKNEKKENLSHYIQEALLYLKLHFKENPNLTETAKAVNLNSNYFSEKFKEITGESYISYLTSLKISYAKKLLSSSELNITEICFASGFTSLSNFMKVFKNKTGISPLKYRKSID